MGDKCWSGKLTFVILFGVCKSKPMSEKESECVMHKNTFVNMCHI